MTARQGPNNHTTVPVLDRHRNPLAPARPSRVRRWLESGRGKKVWTKGIFAVQLTDVDAAHATTGDLALNMDPGETTGIAITRESHDHAERTLVGAYEHQHRNRGIHTNPLQQREKTDNIERPKHPGPTHTTRQPPARPATPPPRPPPASRGLGPPDPRPRQQPSEAGS